MSCGVGTFVPPAASGNSSGVISVHLCDAEIMVRFLKYRHEVKFATYVH